MTAEPARQLLQQYLPGSDLTWFGGQAREDRRIAESLGTPEAPCLDDRGR